MTEWWLIIAFYWTWFLADCVKLSRHPRFSFSRRWGIRAVHTRAGHLLTSAPLPTAWQVIADDIPYSFSPHGLCNQSIASAGRQESAPAVAWRWEDIHELTHRRGRVLINGRDFCAATPLSEVHRLRALVDACRPLATEARAAFLHAQLASWFRPVRLQRRLTSVVGRTRNLATLGSVNFTLAVLATLYLLADGPALLGDAWAARIAASLPLIGSYFVLIHIATVILAWRSHRRLMPARNEERARLVLNALLLPPHALRLRSQLSATAFPPQHPLTWLVVVGDKNTSAPFARAVLADLRWPLAPCPSSSDPLASLITNWLRLEIAPHIEQLLRDAGLDEKKLLRAPTPDSPASCLYCPRCLDQFTQPDARCPRGVKLLALK